VRASARHARALLAAALVAAAAGAQANNNGSQTGRSASGCSTGATCHGANVGATATLTGPMTLMAGSRGTYTLTVASSLATFMAAGVDIAVAGAGASLVTISPNTQLRNGEITHTARLARSGADVQVQFTLVAPAANGTVTLQAVGNAVNGNAMASGDAWARATLPVTITGGTAAPDASVTPDASAPGVEAYDPSASMAYGGCGVTPRGARSRAVLAGAAALALVMRRRRRPCGEG
jgi:hypothetical protein